MRWWPVRRVEDGLCQLPGVREAIVVGMLGKAIRGIDDAGPLFTNPATRYRIALLPDTRAL